MKMDILKNTIKKPFAIFLTLTLFVMLSVGCSKKDVQYDTPEAVAKIFWTAIQNKDIETAKAQVHEPARAQLGRMIASDILGGNVPPLPKELLFKVEENGDSAIAVILNSDGVGCDLIKVDGRWWVR